MPSAAGRSCWGAGDVRWAVGHRKLATDLGDATQGKETVANPRKQKQKVLHVPDFPFARALVAALQKVGVKRLRVNPARAIIYAPNPDVADYLVQAFSRIGFPGARLVVRKGRP